MKPFIALGTIALLSASVMPASASVRVNAGMRRAAATAAIPLGKVATLTKAIPTTMVRDMGTAPLSMPMTVTIALTTRNDSMVNSILAAENTPGNSQYHKYLTPAQSQSLFSPSNASVSAVESFLTSAGFSHLVVSADNELVHASGTVATVNAAFGSAEHVGLYSGSAVLFNSQPAVVPTALGSIVRSVIGLHTIPMKTNHVTRLKGQRTAGSSCVGLGTNQDCLLNDFTPRAFWVAYDAGGNLPGTDGSLTATYHSGIHTSIGIFAEGLLSQVTSDLRIQENDYALPQVSYTVINETGNPTQTDTSGADEFDLDTQTSSGVAGDVKALDIYDAVSLDDADLILSYDQFKNLDVDKAASASFGGCTSLEELGGDLQAEDAIFAEAATQGQTVFASSGDTGAACEGVENGVPAGVPGTEYPASSEYVIGVGGTSLFTTPANLYQGEIAWTDGGGGPEPFETAGPWTTSLSTLGATGVRSVPDIAMDADPNISGADVTVAGATEIIGGTSLSSPLALAVWARIESNNGNSVGFAGPTLYKEFGDGYTGAQLGRVADYTETVNGFNDVQVGTNTGYAATAGYDYTTGLGTLDIALQIQDINN